MSKIEFTDELLDRQIPGGIFLSSIYTEVQRASIMTSIILQELAEMKSIRTGEPVETIIETWKAAINEEATLRAKELMELGVDPD